MIMALRQGVAGRARRLRERVAGTIGTVRGFLPRRQRFGRLAGAVAVLALPMLLLSSAQAPPVPDYSRIIQEEAAFVASAQLTAGWGCGRGNPALGAIAIQPLAGTSGTFVDVKVGKLHRVVVHLVPNVVAYADPYLANYGAFAMLLAGRDYDGRVLSYIRWYLGNVNYAAQRDTYQGVPGSIFDYMVNLRGCTEAGTGRYDSSDSYAGTFLSLVNAFARADPASAGYFTRRDVHWELGVIANAIVATLNPNGLSSALLSQRPALEYTEDNVEASQGIADYSALLAAENDPAARWWAAAAASMRAAISRTEWLPSAGAYLDAADQRTASFATCTSGTIQLWPSWDLQGTGPWRQAVIGRYTAGDPGWVTTSPGYPDISCTDDHDPESVTAFTAAQTGDSADADAWLVNSEANWVDAGRPYPWTVQDSGFRALTAYVLARGKPYVP
jgi:hypothetical protein